MCPADDTPDGPLTSAQIAERAGVSVTTVSKVLNGRADVAPETRALIEGVIHRHGHLRQKRRAAAPAALLELVFRQMRDTYAIEIIKGVQRVAREHRLAVVLSELQGQDTPGRGWVEEVLARRPTGVISVFAGLTDAQSGQLRSRGIPFVLVDPGGEPAHASPSVGAGNWGGGLAATRHLLELGHRRIAVITGPESSLASRARLDGHRAAMDAAGVPMDPALVRVGDFQTMGGLTRTRELLALPDPPTAVFVCNDAQALGVYRAAAEAGLRIPDDLSVVGFDDLPPARWTIPPLTTVRQPLTEMAATAAAMVVTLAGGEPLRQTRVELATELVVRDSTAPPRRG
ncbi:LacI family DNA-binding transcriptional regulator [Streptomyces litchfieldiae]|uniref:LacI family DNA-binding transcriptional regulator n=1 Tax=Streptomyces litchfieldiae TaxID=3075543 RepID=A0ABU2MU73_9ACTN|nr:LacI family DNA-binding transcriptional regulator [Streptomyces sp. DSM 44938]MDT0345200.1 LacI family DNA-binding transcriptional regulator [Streptomyces sp. DSM 44938]